MASEDYASLMEEEIDLDHTSRTRDPARTRNMDFLKAAFQEFDLNNDRLLQKDELRVALKSINLTTSAADEVYDTLAHSNEDGVQLDEWMDNMPQSLLQKLGDHAKAEAWRQMIEPVEQKQ